MEVVIIMEMEEMELREIGSKDEGPLQKDEFLRVA